MDPSAQMSASSTREQCSRHGDVEGALDDEGVTGAGTAADDRRLVLSREPRTNGVEAKPHIDRVGVGISYVVPHHALASEPLFDTYLRNWLETVSGLSEILGARFDAGMVDAARRELERRGADDFLLELTVLASGTKAA
jgi:hypothetical protein